MPTGVGLWRGKAREGDALAANRPVGLDVVGLLGEGQTARCRGSEGLHPVTTRLLVVTGVRLYSDGLKLLLDAEPEIEVVGTAASDLDALGSTIRLRPDVVLLDMELSGAA